MEFSNQQIVESELPSVLDIKYRSIQKKYRTVSIISATIFALIILAILLTINILSGDTWFYDYIIYIMVGWLLLYCFLILLSFKGFEHKGYAMRERDIIFKKGWIWRSSTIVPFNRVQHTEIEQGPIERLFRLSVLKIFTAGGSSSDLKIPGLLPETANRLKDYIQNKVGRDEEE
ncbi:MAG: PH domain-containing protein [Saprospiraceae bacterium]